MVASARVRSLKIECPQAIIDTAGLISRRVQEEKFVKKTMLAVLLVCCAAAALFSVTPSALADDQDDRTTGGIGLPTLAPVTDANYRIKEEDVLKMDVWGEPQLRDMQMQVTPDGKLNVPYLGEMQAAGLTQAELTRQISQRFEDEGILLDARVQVTILSVNKPVARVLGEVRRPGEINFRDGDRIVDAVAQAGSYTETAWLEKATLTRKGADKPIPIDLKSMFAGDLSQNFELEKGDTIYIPPEHYQNKIYVLGQVMRPGIYSLKDDTSALAAITLAGGPTERGAMRSTVVVRGDPAKPERVQCDLTRVLDKGDLSQDVVLRAGDVVLVPETKKPNWGKVSQVLSAVLSLSYLRRYGLF